MKLFCLFLLSSSMLFAQSDEYLTKEDIIGNDVILAQTFDSLINIIGEDDREEVGINHNISKSIGLLKFSQPIDNGQTRTSNCSATLIGDSYILTAAHCVYSSNKIGAAQYYSFYPSYNLHNMDSDMYSIEENGIFVDPKYDELISRCTDDLKALGHEIESSGCPNWSKHDWAVLKLSKKYDSQKYSSANLASLDNVYNSSELELVGYPFDKVIRKEVRKNFVRDGKSAVLVSYLNMAPPFSAKGNFLIDLESDFSDILTYADMARGMSGGPVITSNGDVFGVVSGMSRTSAHDQEMTKLSKGAFISEAARDLICEWSLKYDEQVACSD